ncbi:Gfo/Idh/MocA family protein [Mangrovimonas futianensis]|uniref:Gfo/Idh/MocA family protein n=1 Tax=Mangrovimonas futianensis TaxID=2895523 RepID=UPI001E55EE2C|nr:Gfo/Idh/MocA family oxidoreductase [Mangrovimonas futianensis]MCF1422754.1 Gfo/Idh/MocA family oxidoreductase [Mangrovimonas futianensis]
MTSNKTINWGIIGLGKIAHKFATDLLTLPNTKLLGVASRSHDKAVDFGKKFGAQKTYGSYEDLVKDPEIDAVYIATPHVFHKENSILCLQHGKAVLCEKPFAMNLEEVTEMIHIAKDHNTLLMEALWTYFLPHFQFVIQQIENKTFGEVLELEADFGFKANYDVTSRLIKKDLGGGSLLDIGIYPIFAALSTLGFPKDIGAEATYFENGVDSSCTMTFSYQHGTKAILKSTLLEDTPTTATFHCETGIIKLNSRFHEPCTVTMSPINGEEKTLDFGYNTIGYSFEAQHINELIRGGLKESPIMNFEFSKRLITLLDQVRDRIALKY